MALLLRNSVAIQAPESGMGTIYQRQAGLMRTGFRAENSNFKNTVAHVADTRRSDWLCAVIEPEHGCDIQGMYL